jgi:hypothetical protein
MVPNFQVRYARHMTHNGTWRPVAAAISLVMVLASVAAFTAARASAAKVYQVGSCSASGELAGCSVQADPRHPVSIVLHVRATPRQKVDVIWDVLCSKGSGSADRSATYTARTPVNHSLPQGFSRPDDCLISANANAHNTLAMLHIKAWVTYQKWAASPSPGPTGTSGSCHPKTSTGKCYEPGEFCPGADHGVTGVAGDGKTIRCENKNGWRWEAV